MLSAATRFGPYEIISPVGAGGMGEVYRARDTRLDRIVAIKVLPSAFVSDPDRLRRFEQEARALSALNHPNILVVHDFGMHDGVPFLVSEFLEGQTLRQQLEGGALSVRKASDFALQVARGLAAAHGKGIIHRDLKPENIFVTRDARVKLLDFGLAKQTQVAAVATQDDATRTAMASHTQAGMVMGTAAYMSPEQVRADAVDHRTDIFSFGAVLYEMLSGTRAFQRNSSVETMTAILKEEPPEIDAARVPLSPGLERVVRRCLEKNPDQRFQSASDLAFAIEALSHTSGATAAVKAVARPRRIRWLVGALVLAVAAAAIAFVAARSGSGNATFRELATGPGTFDAARFTPDGENVVFGASWRGKPFELFTARTDSIESRNLGLPPATVAGISNTGEMLLLQNWHSLFQWNMTGTLARASLAGGAPRVMLDDVCGADVDASGKQIAVVRCGTTQQTLESPVGKVLYRTTGWFSHLRFSRKGDEIAFFDHPISGDDRGYVTVIDLNGKITRLTDDWSGLKGLAWAPDGSAVWFSGSRTGEQSAIWSATRSGRLRKVLDAPADVWLEDVGPRDTALVLEARQMNDIAVRRPDQKSDEIVDTVIHSEGSIAGTSSDGSLLAMSYTGTNSGADYVTYVVNTRTHESIRIGEGDPSGISPDGKWVLAFFPSTPGKMVLYPTGAGEARTFTLNAIRNVAIFCSWTTDSSKLAFTGSDGGKPPRGYLLDVTNGNWRAITPEATTGVLITPDGRYAIAKSGQSGFFVYPIEGGQPATAKGINTGEEIVQWDGSSKHVYVWDRRFPARISLVDPWTGERKLWLETTPPDPSGVLYGNFFISSDGRSYAYRFRRVLSSLYLAQGLK